CQQSSPTQALGDGSDQTAFIRDDRPFTALRPLLHVVDINLADPLACALMMRWNLLDVKEKEAEAEFMGRQNSSRVCTGQAASHSYS
ncbi:hypothetical protein LCGC14_1973540, partial [marine sediment metagenome]